MSSIRLLEVTRTFKDGTMARTDINVEHIQSIEWVSKFQSTAVQMASGHTLWIKESPEYIKEFVNG